MIRRLASNDNVYIRGIQLYNHGRVKNPKFNPELMIAEAKVEGDTDTYNVILDLDVDTEGEENNLKASIYKVGFWCECKAAQTYKGLCKHSVALLKTLSKGEVEVVDYPTPIFLELKKKFEEEERQKRRTEFKKRLEKIKSTYAHAMTRLISEIDIKPNVYLKKIIESVSVDALNMRFKIYSEDIGKEYFIKDIGDFSEAYINKIEYQFGKKFVYNPFIHVFPEEDKKLLEFIYKLKNIKPVIFSAQYLSIPYALWEDFFNLINRQEIFTAYGEGNEYKKIKVDITKPVDIDIFVDMNEEEANIKSEFLKEADVLDWKQRARFVIYKDTLTVLKEPHNFIIYPLFYYNCVEFAADEIQGEIKLNNEDLKEFIEIIYPVAKEYCRFEMSQKVKEFLELKDEELKLKVLFDTYKKRHLCADKIYRWVN